jgi:hypothetical protein
MNWELMLKNIEVKKDRDESESVRDQPVVSQ